MERAMNVLYRPITTKLKEQYTIVDYNSELNPSISLKKIKEEFQDNAHVNEIIDFIEKSDRGII